MKNMKSKVQELKDLLDGKDEISQLLEQIQAKTIPQAFSKLYDMGYEDGKLSGYEEGRNDLVDELDDVELDLSVDTSEID